MANKLVLYIFDIQSHQSFPNKNEGEWNSMIKNGPEHYRKFTKIRIFIREQYFKFSAKIGD